LHRLLAFSSINVVGILRPYFAISGLGSAFQIALGKGYPHCAFATPLRA